jgi:RimJ/RimL family protein N-acetyltransferase
VALAALAAGGIHDPDFMPFNFPWTDAPSPELERNTCQYFWRNRGAWTVDEWNLVMAAVVDGEIVGIQAVEGKNFGKLRAPITGSWLGRAHQGKGIGKEMRAAILHFIFEGLGADVALSGAFDDNGPSLGVSRSLGYEENGDELVLRRGEPGRQIRLRLTRERWEERRRDDIEIEGLEPCREMFGAV